MTARQNLLLFAAAAALTGVVALAFSVGRYPVPLADLLRIVWSWAGGAPHGLDATLETVVLQIRGPRIIAAVLVGAALAAAGAAYQNLFRNPLVSPDILGVSAGAAVGAILGIFLSLGVVAIQSMAFAGGLAAVGMVYVVARAVRGHDPLLVLVLAGVVLGALLGACVALMKYLADPYNQLPAITYWLLGSLASTDARDMWVAAPLLLIGLLPLCIPALTTVAIFGFLQHWNEFIQPLIFLNTESNYTVSLGLRLFQTSPADPGEPKEHLLMAAAVIATIPCILLFFAAQRFFVRGIVMTGIKG